MHDKINFSLEILPSIKERISEATAQEEKNRQIDINNLLRKLVNTHNILDLLRKRGGIELPLVRGAVESDPYAVLTQDGSIIVYENWVGSTYRLQEASE